MNNNGFNQQPNNSGYSYQAVMEIKSRNRGFAVASMILGIIAFLCCCSVYVGITLSVIAIIFAVVSRVRMGYFDGMAIAGLVLGIIGLVFGISTLVVEVVFAEQIEAWLNEFYAQNPDLEAPDGSSQAPNNMF